MNIKELVYCPSYEYAYDNLQDAVEFIGNIANDEEDVIGLGINVCEKIKPTHNSFLNAKDLINEMQGRAYEEHSEWSEDYLSDVEFDGEKLKSLNLLLEKWFNENASQPTFYQAGKHIKTIVVDKDLLIKYGVEF